MTQKLRPTAEDHEQIGMRLKLIEAELIQLWVFVANSYPNTERFVRQLDKAVRSVKDAKNIGDAVSSNEHPSEFSTRWYYGPSPTLADAMALPDLESRRQQRELDALHEKYGAK